MEMKVINLRHLVIRDKKQIGIKFYPDKVVQALIKTLPNVKWTSKYNMAYIQNNKENLNLIFDTFRNVAWVNTAHFFTNKPISKNNIPLNLDKYRNKTVAKDFIKCPDNYLI